ncbi:RNA polymerase sigma factor [Porticoccaceae bacterium LTM1]|nr:RNA polymerase sigma factor [Porticoccaceae bacterium LTM1]
MSLSTRKKSNVIKLKGRRKETNEQVLERLFREHGRALRTFLTGRVRIEEDQEDVIQEIFARMARMDDLQQKLAVNRSDNRAFLFTSANNYVIDQERRKILEKRYQQEHLNQDDYLVVEASPEVIVESSQELALVKQAIGNLRPTWRRAFVLSRFEHLSYPQIAEKMDISVKTVEKYITNALVELRDVTAKAHTIASYR